MKLSYKEMQAYADGLSSETVMPTYTTIENGRKQEWHRHPKGGVVVIESWSVMDGECISTEFEVVEVIPKGGYAGELVRLCGE